MTNWISNLNVRLLRGPQGEHYENASNYRKHRKLRDCGFKDDHHGRWKCRKRRSSFLPKLQGQDYPRHQILLKVLGERVIKKSVIF